MSSTTDESAEWANRLNKYRSNVAGKRLSVAGHHHQSFSLGNSMTSGAAGKRPLPGGSGLEALPDMGIIPDDDDDDGDDTDVHISVNAANQFSTPPLEHSASTTSTSLQSNSLGIDGYTRHHGRGHGHDDDDDGISFYYERTGTVSTMDRDGAEGGAHDAPTWVRLVSPYNPRFTLYYNTISKQTSFLRPDDYASPLSDDDDDDDLDDDDDDDDEDDEDEDDDDNDTSRVDTETGGAEEHRAAKRRNRRYRHHRRTPPTAGFLGFNDDTALAEGQADPLALILHHLKAAAAHVDRTVSHLASVDEQSQSIYQAITALKSDLAKTKKLVLDVSGGEAGMVSSVDSLIGWDQHRWNFTPSKAIRYYRASSSKTDHQSVMFTQWNMPQYFSTQPLLPSATKIRLHVSLGRGFTVDADGVVTVTTTPTTITTAGGGAPIVSRRTTLEVSDDEITSTIIHKAIQKLFPHDAAARVDPNGFVLKVVGHHEYLDHPYQVFSYAHIRKSIRDFLDVDTVLVPRPSSAIPKEQVEMCTERQQQYESKIDKSVQLLGPSTFRDLTDLSFLSVDQLEHVTDIPMTSVCVPFSVEIVGLDNLTREALPRLTSKITSVYVQALLFHGSTVLPFNQSTPPIDLTSTVYLRTTLHGSWTTLIANLPRETRIAYVVMGRHANKAKEDVALGWVVAQLVDVSGEMLSGQVDHVMWSLAAVEGKKHGKKRDTDPHYLFRAPPYDNLTLGIQKTTIRVRYQEFMHPVVAPITHAYVEPVIGMVGAAIDKRLDESQASLLIATLNDALSKELTPEGKQLLWNCRHYLIDIPSALPKLLRCVDWSSQDYRNEAHRMLQMWAIPENKIDAIELLDVHFADYTVREYAVYILRMLPDDQLQMFCLQLIQCLKFECYHDSPLSRFLVERSIASPWTVGHAVFWHLKAEVHDPYVCERFSLILEEILSHSSLMVDELYKQHEVVRALQTVAERITQMKHEFHSTHDEMVSEYKKTLHRLNRDLFTRIGKFKAPLNPRQEATTLIVDKCRFMSSKMVPLLLVFNNADEDGAPIVFIFKSGDDLRQDFLTLQLLRVMDNLWLQRGLDMRLKPYAVIATGINSIGEGVGMIEVVLHSDTLSSIQVEFGGGSLGAFSDKTLDFYIRQYNTDAQSYMRAVDNFVRSSAGYCAATFVMGVGDRHNGNIMLTRGGHLFHIDFGHFLGNFKSKFGMKRERTAFVFTREMAYVMGGRDYAQSPLFGDFKKLLTRSFHVLRSNARLLQNLFSLMIVAQMPELLKESDVDYLRKQLYLEVNAKQASAELQSELSKSLVNTFKRFDNYVHNVIHTK